MEGCILWEWKIITNMITWVFLNWTRRCRFIRSYTVRKHTNRRRSFISLRNGRGSRKSSLIQIDGIMITKQIYVLRTMMSGKVRRKENVGWMIPRPLSFALNRNSPTDSMIFSTIQFCRKQCKCSQRNSTAHCTVHSKASWIQVRSPSEWVPPSELYRSCFNELW